MSEAGQAQALVIGLLAGLICQILLNATPLLNIPSEVLLARSPAAC